MKITIDFSQFGIENELRLRVDALLVRLFPSTHIVISPSEARMGNKGGFAVYFDNYSWYSYDPSEPAKGVGLISLIAEVKYLDFAEAILWAKVFIQEHKESGAPVKFRSIKIHKDKKEQNQKRARQLLADASNIEGTKAAIYLAQRHIPYADIPPSARRELRFCRLQYPYTTRIFPVLAAMVRDHENNVVSAFRIFLSKDGKTKAPVEMPKLALGSTSGASIHLTPARSWLILTEGLEDGLSVLLAIKKHPAYGVWCGIGGNLPSIVIPKTTVRNVVLAFDKDAGGRGFIKELAPRLIREGFRVYVAVPTHGKDFNEMACRYGRSFNLDLMEEYHD